jgi:hypothetical protein
MNKCPRCGLEIIEHPANRCLDAWIAEAVTGWKAKHQEDKCNGEYFIRCGACGEYGHGNCFGDGRGAVQIKCGEYVACCDDAELPEYRIDISAAWEVVEKLRKSFDVVIDLDDELTSCRILRRVDDEWNREMLVEQIFESTPYAICRAALLAVMEA